MSLTSFSLALVAPEGTFDVSEEKLHDERLEELDNRLTSFVILRIKYSNEVKSDPIYWRLLHMMASIKRNDATYYRDKD